MFRKAGCILVLLSSSVLFSENFNTCDHFCRDGSPINPNLPQINWCTSKQFSGLCCTCSCTQKVQNAFGNQYASMCKSQPGTNVTNNNSNQGHATPAPAAIIAALKGVSFCDSSTLANQICKRASGIFYVGNSTEPVKLGAFVNNSAGHLVVTNNNPPHGSLPPAGVSQMPAGPIAPGTTPNVVNASNVDRAVIPDPTTGPANDSQPSVADKPDASGDDDDQKEAKLFKMAGLALSPTKDNNVIGVVTLEQTSGDPSSPHVKVNFTGFVLDSKNVQVARVKPTTPNVVVTALSGQKVAFTITPPLKNPGTYTVKVVGAVPFSGDYNLFNSIDVGGYTVLTPNQEFILKSAHEEGTATITIADNSPKENPAAADPSSVAADCPGCGKSLFGNWAVSLKNSTTDGTYSTGPGTITFVGGTITCNSIQVLRCSSAYNNQFGVADATQRPCAVNSAQGCSGNATFSFSGNNVVRQITMKGVIDSDYDAHMVNVYGQGAGTSYTLKATPTITLSTGCSFVANQPDTFNFAFDSNNNLTGFSQKTKTASYTAGAATLPTPTITLFDPTIVEFYGDDYSDFKISAGSATYKPGTGSKTCACGLVWDENNGNCHR